MCRLIVASQPQNAQVDFIDIMAAHKCVGAGEDQEFLQHRFQGLSEVITSTFQINAQVQQAQVMTQTQINQLLEEHANL